MLKKTKKWLLFSPSGEQVTDFEFDKIESPNLEQFLRFAELADIPKRLIAIGHRTENGFSKQIGIDSNGGLIDLASTVAKTPKPENQNSIVPKIIVGVKEAICDRSSITEVAIINDYSQVPDLEVLPKFLDGSDTAFLDFFKKHIAYPQLAREKRTQGMARVEFYLNKDGLMTEPSIACDIGDGCGEEALRLVKLMPKWKPAQKNGRPVCVQCLINVPFVLD